MPIPVAAAAAKLVSAGSKLINPADVAVQLGTQFQKKASQQSIELFNYDFVALAVKLIVYFVAAYVITKLMEAIIFARGGFVIIANLLGFNIPSSEQVPQQLKDLFGEGLHGVKFWSAVKVIAVLLVVWEYLNYVEVNSRNGGKPSPLTTGVFLMIGLGLSLTVFPELLARFNKFKKTDNNLENLV